MSKRMIRAGLMVLVLGAAAALTAPSCHDLSVSGTGECVMNADTQSFLVKAEVTSQGKDKSCECLLYADAVNPNVPTGTSEIQEQQSAEMSPLNPGDVFKHKFMFTAEKLSSHHVEYIRLGLKCPCKDCIDTNNSYQVPFPGCQ